MRNQHVQLEISSMNKNDPFRNDSQAKLSMWKNQLKEFLILFANKKNYINFFETV